MLLPAPELQRPAKHHEGIVVPPLGYEQVAHNAQNRCDIMRVLPALDLREDSGAGLTFAADASQNFNGLQRFPSSILTSGLNIGDPFPRGFATGSQCTICNTGGNLREHTCMSTHSWYV